jgi:sugar lactone lactonase YvrE
MTGIRAVVGSGEAGLLDGDFATARFDYPQGLGLVGDTPDRQVLYVADAENHAIRGVDLAGGQVSTVAGTGEQARRFNVAGHARSTPLSSPWDVVHVPGGGNDGRLYVAMAGTHQIWAIDLARDEARPYAGSGAEDIHDGALRGAALAQPMGLTSDGQRLYFADSESSAVRWADLSPNGQVGTLVGTGLFDFGDADGAGDAARLQHDQGVSWSDGRLFVADSYNQKIKVVDPATRRATTLLGDGEPGLVDGAAPRFWEPAGLCALGDRLFIADTNNHAIRVADLKTGEVWTLALRE